VIVGFHPDANCLVRVPCHASSSRGVSTPCCPEGFYKKTGLQVRPTRRPRPIGKPLMIRIALKSVNALHHDFGAVGTLNESVGNSYVEKILSRHRGPNAVQ
jgi:hypothetical protein